MTFAPSAPPDISESLPFSFSARQASQEIVRSGHLYDYTIGGIGFMADPTERDWYERASLPVQKQQFDTSREAGEQTLGGYWVRSQVSWHRGDGINFYEPGGDDLTSYRFGESLGVNVWNVGRVTLLKKMFHAQPLSATFGFAPVPWGMFADLNGPRSVTPRLDYPSMIDVLDTTAVPASPAQAMGTRPASDGTNMYWGNASGVFKGTTSSVSALHTQTSGAAPVPYIAKGRMILARDYQLFEATLTTTLNLDTATPLHSSADIFFRTVDVAESPTAILVAANTAGRGVILRFTLEDAPSGQTPKLSQAYQIAELPRGETLYAMMTYLGKYVGLGTSKGLRIGIIEDGGNITFGPLLIKTTSPVQSLAAYDSFLYAGVTAGLPNGLSGVVRVNLAEQIGNGLQFAWAWDVCSGAAGAVSHVGICKDQVYAFVDGSGLWVECSRDLEPTGYVTSGRIRYGTIEPKLARLVDADGEIDVGAINLSVVDKAGAETFIASLNSQTGVGRNVSMGNPLPSENVRVKATLVKDVETTFMGPALTSLQVKALPAPRRLRRISLKLAIADFDRSRNGGTCGSQGFGWQRLAALEEIEDQSVLTTVVDFNTGERFTGVIEQVSFTRTGQQAGNAGGYGKIPVTGVATVVLRKL